MMRLASFGPFFVVVAFPRPPCPSFGSVFVMAAFPVADFVIRIYYKTTTTTTTTTTIILTKIAPACLAARLILIPSL